MEGFLYSLATCGSLVPTCAVASESSVNLRIAARVGHDFVQLKNKRYNHQNSSKNPLDCTKVR